MPTQNAERRIDKLAHKSRACPELAVMCLGYAVMEIGVDYVSMSTLVTLGILERCSRSIVRKYTSLIFLFLASVVPRPQQPQPQIRDGVLQITPQQLW